jgi:hypothetical protein
MPDFAGLIRTLVDARVDFILVGGVAATVHGSARLTRAVDVVYARTPENLRRLVDGCRLRLRDKRLTTQGSRSCAIDGRKSKHPER